ncbi:MAG TPA: GNAT family N-acetyltransferase [Pyrinomonadaceae bacterium]|jgi:RimJ/RimL family protein N-acetyltransferase|nr:GNAT family N-acetyltransferase [Pyrinomonadaceae bacterium]
MIQLETERLIMRMWREDDFEPFARMCADPEVMRYLTKEGRPLTRMEAWRNLAFFIGHWHLRGYGHWAVEEKASGNLIGRIGFLEPEGWPDFEIGWTLVREHWGKGYAIEGARRALAYAFTEMNRDRVISLILPGNRASISVAERLGEKFEGRANVGGLDALVYGMRRDEWGGA